VSKALRSCELCVGPVAAAVSPLLTCTANGSSPESTGIRGGGGRCVWGEGNAFVLPAVLCLCACSSISHHCCSASCCCAASLSVRSQLVLMSLLAITAAI